MIMTAVFIAVLRLVCAIADACGASGKVNGSKWIAGGVGNGNGDEMLNLYERPFSLCLAVSLM